MRRSLLPIAMCLALSPLQAATTINVSNTVVVPSVKRFGINLGWMNNYDSGQIMKNLLFRNPGFEGLLYRSIVRCTSSTPASFVDENQFEVWPTGFWNGASYEVITGTAKGATGTIVTSTAPVPPSGTTYQLNGSSPALGDYVRLIRLPELGSIGNAWIPTTNSGGSVTVESTDLPPGTEGQQAVQIIAPATLSAGFDASVAGPFVQLHGAFRLTFKAKGVGGPNSVSITLQRQPSTTFFNQTATLSTAWSTYNIDFTAAENLPPAGGIGLRIAPAAGASILLDDVALTQTDGDSTNTTGFRDAVVDALRQYHPGILRYWVEDLGDTLDNELAPPFGRMRAGYSSRAASRDDLLYGLHEFLELCELLGAEPWYIVPTNFSAQEMTNLMEYLGGPAISVYGARRAARGHPTPWTSAFSRIHLEFGNESWNNFDYYGGAISDSPSYGARAGEMFGVARSSPYYSGAKFNLVAGGQANFTNRNSMIQNATTNHDALAVAPYIGGYTDSFSTNEDLFGPLFAEPEMVNEGATGYMRVNFNNMQASSHPVPLAIYEVNLHTTQPSPPSQPLQIPQATLDTFTPSVGAGVAVADHMLMMLRDFGIRDQNLYSLTQFANSRPDGKYVLLWGSVRDMGVTDRRRPQFLAAELANQALAGDLVQATQSGDNPTWNQPLVNQIQYPNAHCIQSYALASGAQRSVMVFNLNRTGALSVNFTGLNAPRGRVTLQQLTSAAITDTNESASTVAATTQTLSGFDPTALLSLPPFSMTLLQSIKGDINGDGQLNVADVFYLINNLFAAGPAPIGDADVNGDGQVGVADVFYLINFLFAAGAPPA